MLLPRVFGDGFFDDMFDDVFKPLPRANDIMKTDLKEFDENYELSIELPGIKKEDVEVTLKDGYLVVSSESKFDKEEKGKLLKTERFYGKMSRSYFVGDNITEEDVDARFSDGLLFISIPKDKPKKLEEKRYIPIR